jgi:D-psicose/D-tagatose/L-ribulose 3-epimerase
MKCKLQLALVLVVSLCSLPVFSADSTNGVAAIAVPPPVPDYPIGWCIRAKTNVFADAKAAGFEYVELALQDVLPLADGDFAQLAAELHRLNLRALSGYNPIPKELKLVGPEVDAAKLDEHTSRLIARAASLKLTYLVLNSAASWKVPDGFDHDRAFGQLADFSSRFAAAADKHGVTVLIEPMRGTDSNMITNVAEAVKLVEAVARPNFQLMVDYSFLTIQQDDPKNLLAAGKHLRNVHISNPSANRTYPMADGESDYVAFFSVLKQIGYRGGLSVHGGTQAFSNDAPRAITFLRGKARELKGAAAP